MNSGKVDIFTDVKLRLQNRIKEGKCALCGDYLVPDKTVEIEDKNIWEHKFRVCARHKLLVESNGT